MLGIARCFNVEIEHFFARGEQVVAAARKDASPGFEEKFGGEKCV